MERDEPGFNSSFGSSVGSSILASILPAPKSSFSTSLNKSLNDANGFVKPLLDPGPSPHINSSMRGDMGGASTVFQVVYNFVNVVVGAGIVGLPWVFVQGGFWTAIVEILLCCVLTDYSVNMLVATGIEHKKHNYEDLCMLAFGSVGHFTVSVVMTIFDYGAMLSYIIIMGDAASFALDELSGCEYHT
jgi:hypothetical protein